MRPDIVGISSLFTPYYREALEIAARVKKRLSVCRSSWAAPMLPQRRNRCSHLPTLTIVIRGEGERAFVEFLHSLQGQLPIEEVPGLGYKKDDRFCI